MKKFFMSLFVILFTLVLVGCGTKGTYQKGGDAPEWVRKGSGAFDTKNGKVLYGVGLVTPDPNPALERKTAENRALGELGMALNTHVSSLMKDFMESHKDFTSPENSGSVQYVSNIAKTVTDATMSGAEVIDFWKDEAGNLYALARLSYDSVVESLKAKVKEAQEQQAIFLKEKATEAMDELNKELDKKK